MKAMINGISISPRWMYRLVRWAFGAFFISIGFLYADAWPAFIFGGIFIITSFFVPHQCVGGQCKLDGKDLQQLKKD